MSKATIEQTYKSKVSAFDQTINDYISSSERCGNTYAKDKFKDYMETVAKICLSDVTNIDNDSKNIVINTLYHHGTDDFLRKYARSLESHPRTPNNKDIVKVSDEWVERAKNDLKLVRSTVRTQLKDLLAQSVETGRTPSKKQALDYAVGEMNKILDTVPDNDERNYLRAYTDAWIQKTGGDFYDKSLRDNPRQVNNNYPWNKRTSPSSKLPPIKKPIYNMPMSVYGKTYKSFSGHDMVCVVDMPLPSGGNAVKVVGSLQTVTYSIHNEKSPVRAIGDMNAKGYVFGPRTIAGTLIFSVFNKHWAHEIMEEYLNDAAVKAHFLADELPPFNMTISCANEYGSEARLAIYGITLVNEGQVMSINDVYTENTYQYFAKDIDYLTDVVNTGMNTIPNNSSLPVVKNKVQTESVAYIQDRTDLSTPQKPETDTSEDPDEPKIDNPNYNVPAQIFYSNLNDIRVQTQDTIIKKMNSGAITQAEAQRLITKNNENYNTKYAKAKAHYDRSEK